MKNLKFLAGVLCGFCLFSLMAATYEGSEKETYEFHVAIGEGKVILYESNSGDFKVIKPDDIKKSGSLPNDFGWNKKKP
ncbi:hypothetical protein [Aquimarina macrocephali]|uniref:hypothetical protein n=1 Tax=Aquimarina macrocephali TaxID=666563 RepID=UPI0004641239|nr:hypothetical protein [Aquimarina macrocephali]